MFVACVIQARTSDGLLKRSHVSRPLYAGPGKIDSSNVSHFFLQVQLMSAVLPGYRSCSVCTADNPRSPTRAHPPLPPRIFFRRLLFLFSLAQVSIHSVRSPAHFRRRHTPCAHRPQPQVKARSRLAPLPPRQHAPPTTHNPTPSNRQPQPPSHPPTRLPRPPIALQTHPLSHRPTLPSAPDSAPRHRKRG